MTNPWHPTQADEQICDEFAELFEADEPEEGYSAFEKLGMFLGWLDEDWELPDEEFNNNIICNQAYMKMRHKMNYFAKRTGMIYPGED